MKSIQNNKFSGNNGLTKAFMKAFGMDLKNSLSFQQQKQQTKIYEAFYKGKQQLN